MNPFTVDKVPIGSKWMSAIRPDDVVQVLEVFQAENEVLLADVADSSIKPYRMDFVKLRHRYLMLEV